MFQGNDSVMICKSLADVASFEQGTNSPSPGSYYTALRNVRYFVC